MPKLPQVTGVDRTEQVTEPRRRKWGEGGGSSNLLLSGKQLADGEGAPGSESSVAETKPVLCCQRCALPAAPVLPQLPPL